MPSAPTSSTTRLRSKTSDLSDLLRGGRNDNRHPESNLPPVPPLPVAEAETPTKSKHKMSFFARRRKSSSVSPASAKSAEGRVQRDCDVPPLPHPVTGRISTRGTGSPPSPHSPSIPHTNLPSSLPPLNVSPPTFGALSQLIHSKSVKRLSGGHEGQKPRPGSSIPVPALNRLRPQKSTSFEFTRRSEESESTIPGRPPGSGRRKSRGSSHSRVHSGGRPTITVSAPPDADDDGIPTPRPPPSRSSPPCPQSPTSAERTNRRKSRDAPDSGGSDGPTSPHSLMHFPIPPADDASSDAELEFGSNRSSISANSLSSTHDAIALPSRSSREQKRAGTSLLRDPAKINTPGRVISRSAPEPSTHSPQLVPSSATASISGPGSIASGSTSGTRAGSASPPRSRIPASASGLRGKVPPPLLTTFRRSRGGPPTDPLPSPPPSTPASMHSLNQAIASDDQCQSDSGTSLNTMPSIPSMTSRMSVGQVHQLLFRHRAGTVTSVASTSTGSGTLASTGSGALVNDVNSSPPTTPLRERFLAEHASTSRAPALESVHEDQTDGHDLMTTAQLREALQAQTAKYQRLSNYLLTLSERHAAEKSELMRRVETLEREARRREREITGLRWLVMNAGSSPTMGNGAGSGKEGQAKAAASAKVRDRARSSPSTPGTGSGLQGSHKNGWKNSGTPPERGASVDSHAERESMEEGLFEMQKSVSDLIAPLQASPSPSVALASPVPVGRMGLRRVNTWSMHDTGCVPSASSALPTRRPRRTSSPVLPAASSSAMGLGIDIADFPSIPSLPDSEIGHGMPASSSSIPSLTAANTASSGLSAIPETPVKGSIDKHVSETPHRQPKRESTVTGSSRTRPISASSFSTPASAYASNLKMNSSPSICQVLDSASVSDNDSDVRSLLDKLQSCGSR